MIIKGLLQNVNTDAELKALSQATLTNQQLVWHVGLDCAFMYFAKGSEGNFAPDDQTGGVGFWVKESLEGLDLEQFKAFRYKEIDARTEELILNGFSYASKLFSLSQNAQINILALHETRNDPALTYPIEYSTLNDNDNYFVTDATDLHNMYLTALATKKAHVDSGTLIKDSIRAAADEAAVDAIIDNR